MSADMCKVSKKIYSRASTWMSKYSVSTLVCSMNLAVDLFLYYFSWILEKWLFWMEEKNLGKGSNVRIAEKMSAQMFEKRLQICNVIVQPCAAWWDFGLVFYWHGLLTVFMIRYIAVLIVTLTLKLMIKKKKKCARSFIVSKWIFEL